MMNKPIFVVDQISSVVEKVSLKLTNQLKEIDSKITGVHYQHGHPLEIVTTLTQLGQGTTSKTDRFPLVALFQDFPEDKAQNGLGYYADVTLHLIIAMGTDQNYKAAQRYEKNFKPFLYPIYFEFLNQLRLSKFYELIGGDEYPHQKIDRLFYGKEGLYGNTANIANDRLDCIEIRDLKLRVKKQNC